MEDRICGLRLFSRLARNFGNLAVALGVDASKRGCNFTANQYCCRDHLLRFRRNRVEYSTELE